MTAIDNSQQIAALMGQANDGDVFWYTEILDRTKRSAGDNRKRMVRLFRHGSGPELLELMPMIRSLCIATGARAYTRLSPRSHKAVAKQLLLLTAEMVASEQWNSASYLYARACGRCNIHDRRLWLYDVDEANADAVALEMRLTAHGNLVAVVPSRSAYHLIAKPHDPRLDGENLFGIQLHKDNPTNLYIPNDRDGGGG
jgi:hypothetical protein